MTIEHARAVPIKQGEAFSSQHLKTPNKPGLTPRPPRGVEAHLPVEEVVPSWPGTARSRRVLLQVLQPDQAVKHSSHSSGGWVSRKTQILLLASTAPGQSGAPHVLVQGSLSKGGKRESLSTAATHPEAQQGSRPGAPLIYALMPSLGRALAWPSVLVCRKWSRAFPLRLTHANHSMVRNVAKQAVAWVTEGGAIYRRQRPAFTKLLGFESKGFLKGFTILGHQALSCVPGAALTPSCQSHANRMVDITLELQCHSPPLQATRRTAKRSRQSHWVARCPSRQAL